MLALSELPRGWGLLEIGTGAPVVVHPAEERRAEQPSGPQFMKALLRAAHARIAAERRGEGDAPRQAVVGHLARPFVALACGHRALAPLAKVAPSWLPCWSCAEGKPADVVVLGDAIEALPSAEEVEVVSLIAQGRLRRQRPDLAEQCRAELAPGLARAPARAPRVRVAAGGDR